MSNFETIKDLIQKSDLSAEDKIIMTDVFAIIPDEHLADPAKLFQTDPASITMLNENRKKKIKAFSEGDTALWESILEEEKHYISDLTYDLD